MTFEQEANDTVYNKQIFSEKFKLMTHLFHSKLERNRRNVIMQNSKDLRKFISDNKTLLIKIKKSILKEYNYEVTNFQVNVACSFFLNIKFTKMD
jgi:hypothetical protein